MACGEIKGIDLYQVALLHRLRNERAARMHDIWMITCELFAYALRDPVIRGALWCAAALLGGIVAGWIVYGGPK